MAKLRVSDPEEFARVAKGEGQKLIKVEAEMTERNLASSSNEGKNIKLSG